MAVGIPLWTHVRDSYFSSKDPFWGNPSDELPAMQTLSRRATTVLCRLFDELQMTYADRFVGARFLLNFLHASGQAPSRECDAVLEWPSGLPDWLLAALQRFPEKTESIGGGTRALAKLAGRSPEHVSRTLRQWTGLTPLEWVTGVRLRRAAAKLRVGNRKVLDIASECGFESLGHFYRLFSKEFGTSPGAYRMQFSSRLI